MKSYQNSFNEFNYYITPSDMIEFLYCKRFIYYMKCLGIQQYEEKRYKVQKGREVHSQKEVRNKEYLRKKIGVVDKQIEVNLYSEKYCINGIVDEVLTLTDGTMAPLDYKFAEYDEIVYSTYKMQILMYSLMISEMYGAKVNKGYLVYCRSRNKLVEVEITEEDISKLKKDIEEYKKILNGYFPSATKTKKRCIDCCYRNICIK